MAVSRRFIFLILFVFYVKTTALADTKVWVLNNVLVQRGQSGNQVFDGSGNQTMEVYEPTTYVETQITPDTKINGSFLIDSWSSASEAIFDTTTGASRRSPFGDKVYQYRYALDASVTHEHESWEFTPSVGYSKEYDYQSINGGVSVSRGFKEDNFVASLGYHVFADEIWSFDVDSRSFNGWRDRTSHSIDASVSQILSPSDLVILGYHMTHQRGELASNINSVNLLGIRTNEVLPTHRTRQASNVKFIHAFSDHWALHTSYRYYWDNWGIKSHTVEPALYYSFADDDGMASLFYRFHHQSASDFYQASFNSPLRYMTSDSDLAQFSAQEVGGQFLYDVHLTHDVKVFQVGASALYYRRSDELWATLFQLSLAGTF